MTEDIGTVPKLSFPLRKMLVAGAFTRQPEAVIERHELGRSAAAATRRGL
jgi:hypothetical protein